MGSYVEKWLETDQTLEKFNKLVNRGKMALSTRRNYVKHVKALVDHLDAETPQQALELLRNHENPTQLLEDFVDEALTRMTASSVSIIMRAGIKKWLELNKAPIDWKYIKREVEPRSVRVTSDRAPTRKELNEIANVTGLRDKTFIAVAISSGLRVGALSSLTFGDVTLQDEIPKVVVRRIPGRKISKDMPDGFGTFISPEAKRLLLQYRKHRELKGEAVTAESPLFTSNRIDRKGEQGRALSPGYLTNHWRRILRRAFKTDKSHKWFKLHLHTLRKFFRTQCNVSGVETDFMEFWMGHVGRNLSTSYFRAEDTAHLEQYKKVLPLLTLESPDLEERIKEVEERYKERLENMRLEAERRIEERVRQRINELEAKAKISVIDLKPELQKMVEEMFAEMIKEGKIKNVVVSVEQKKIVET